ncbi:hypothetical protein [Streptomyces cyaneofuscatus]|uniref:hypothetical protein n=1 Tax=Streptomyces cyaneofuscatus TaxID=66883 RepID=UPI0036D7C8E1
MISRVVDTRDGPLRGSLRVALRYVGSATGRGSGGFGRTEGVGDGFVAGLGAGAAL